MKSCSVIWKSGGNIHWLAQIYFLDIDECAQGNHGCDATALRSVTIQTDINCSCKPRFEAYDYNCTVMILCARSTFAANI